MVWKYTCPKGIWWVGPSQLSLECGTSVSVTGLPILVLRNANVWARGPGRGHGADSLAIQQPCWRSFCRQRFSLLSPVRVFTVLVSAGRAWHMLFIWCGSKHFEKHLKLCSSSSEMPRRLWPLSVCPPTLVCLHGSSSFGDGSCWHLQAPAEAAAAAWLVKYSPVWSRGRNYFQTRRTRWYRKTHLDHFGLD